MTWQEVLDDKSLSDLPYKIELNKEGCIVMSPASNRHAKFQGRITGRLCRLSKEGEVLTECSVKTADNVKVPDVAWASESFLKKNGDVTPFENAPDICVEVYSPSNTEASMRRKRELYFQKGAKEVWICDKDGALKFYDVTSELSKSKLFPRFPKTI